MITTKTAHLPAKLAHDLDRHFDELVVAFQLPLFTYAYRACGSRQDAEEIVQDAFVRAHRALSAYEPARIRELALSAWLYRICINLARNRYRKTILPGAELPPELMSPDGSDPVARSVEMIEAGAEMSRRVAELPYKYRAPVVLRFVNELSYPEIAAVLEQPEGSVKSTVHRGLKLLRTAIENEKRHHAAADARTTPAATTPIPTTISTPSHDLPPEAFQ